MTTSHLRACTLALALIASPLSMASSDTHAMPKGELYLVSAGTGDPENMTLRAHRLIQSADLVLTMGGRKDALDALIKDKPVLDAGHGLFGLSIDKKTGEKLTEEKQLENAVKAARSKKTAEEIRAQRDENRKRIREAVAAGKKVVIIDNGDPTIFGPQIGYMNEFADLNPQVVPGPSSFNAANAALARSVVGGKNRAVMLTMAAQMHQDDSADRMARLIADGTTVVFFMERDTPRFLDALKKRLPGSTPIALVSNAGSQQSQQVIQATLDTLMARIGENKPKNYLVYVGEFLE
ncbi:MAG: SAM-dependent methyltransferase [Halothiobacillaceae bacterium]|nr:SAM-dependent methyltransferase [Halothiobacillaceae bacterium]